MKPLYLSSEAVRAGHPDKICDYIADWILDKYTATDPDSKCAIEVMGTGNNFIIGGEVQSKGVVTDTQIKEEIADIMSRFSYPSDDLHIQNLIQSQSPEISNKVTDKGILRAGDMGITYGYAEADTKSMLPPAYEVATGLMFELDREYRSWDLGILADGKCTVTTFGKSIAKVYMAIQAKKDADYNAIYDAIKNKVIDPLIKLYGYDTEGKYAFVLDCDGFTIGGTQADTGLTGRKIQNDTYGTVAHNGGGSFSGKDMTKVDRSGAYYARWIAEKAVLAGLADKCEVRMEWKIGSTNPTDITFNFFGQDIDHDAYIEFLKYNANLTVGDILTQFTPDSFASLTNYGHFTDWHTDLEGIPWERPRVEYKGQKEECA